MLDFEGLPSGMPACGETAVPFTIKVPNSSSHLRWKIIIFFKNLCFFILRSPPSPFIIALGSIQWIIWIFPEWFHYQTSRDEVEGKQGGSEGLAGVVTSSSGLLRCCLWKFLRNLTTTTNAILKLLFFKSTNFFTYISVGFQWFSLDQILMDLIQNWT